MPKLNSSKAAPKPAGKKNIVTTKKTTSVSAQILTADQFIKKLKIFQPAEEQKKIQRYFKSGEGQ